MNEMPNRSRAFLWMAALALLLPAACSAQNPTPVAPSAALAAPGGGAPNGTATATPNGAVAAVAVSGQEVGMTAGLESAYVLQGSPGEVYLVVDLNAAAAANQQIRPAMAVALVIDRSGSMAGDKIVHARAAASSFIQNMADGDVVAIYQYDDVVEQVAPPTLIDANSRGALIGMVQRITPRGSTNLFGGMMAGLEALYSASAERPVRRVILISDGLANVGPSSPSELGNAAASGAARGVSVTSIGVGLDYDENTMAAVAVRSGGRFYHMQEPAQLAAILETELNSLGATVARGVYLELVPAPGVQILGATGADLVQQGSTVRLNVGDLLGEQRRQVVVPLRVPTDGAPQRALGDLTLRYRAASTDAERAHEAQVSYQLASNQTQVDEAVEPRFVVAVESYRANQARREAARLVAEGQADQAAEVLEAQAQATRERAEAVGGEAAEDMFEDSEGMGQRANEVRAARSAPAARAQQLELADEALEAEGY